VGGVSVGAHAVARWAAHDERAAELEGLLLVMPAWTGTDSGTAAITEASAKALRREGVHAELLRMSLDRSLQHDWVMSELSRAWPRQADTLAAALLRTARSRGPYISELAQLNQPVGIVALADDVLHPESVAERWHHYLRRSAVVQVARHAPAKDRSVIGVAAVQALQLARRRTAPMRTTAAAH
jgi:pimeloyl-ACP methyl ester carboxylesterase